MIDPVTGDITIDVGNNKPKRVTMWYADTCSLHNARRDFRLITWDNPCTCGIFSPLGKRPNCFNLMIIWRSKPVYEQPDRPGVYVASVDTPKKGWRGFFVDIEFGEEYSSPK